MLVIKPIDFPIQDANLRNSIETFIPANLAVCLDGLDPFQIKNAKIIAFAAFDNNQLVGITIASAYELLKEADIHCLLVTNEDSEDRLSQLLQQMTEKLKEMDISVAAFNFIEESPISKSLQKVFIANKWQGPQLQSLEYHFNVAEFHPRWFEEKIKLDPSFIIMRWKDLSKMDLSSIEQQIEEGKIPFYVSPFVGSYPIENENSLALMHSGKVIGWMIVHRIAQNEIRYSALYLDKEFSYSKYWLTLLQVSIRLQAEKMVSQVPFSSLEMNLNQIPLSWKIFAERHLAPFTKKILHKSVFWKTL